MPKPNAPTPAAPVSNMPALPTLFMGIDPSLTSTGLSVIVNGMVVAERLAAPFTPAQPVQRLQWFYETFCARLDRWQPVCVGIEGYAFGATSRAHALGELGGVLRLALAQRKVHALSIPPNSLKQFVTGRGDAEKDTISKELFKRWGIDLNQNDEVDSAALAVMTLASKHPLPGLTAKQREALTKIAPLDIVRARPSLQPGAKPLTKHPALSSLGLSATVRH